MALDCSVITPLQEPKGFLQQMGDELGMAVFLGEKEEDSVGYFASVEDVDGGIHGRFRAYRCPFDPAAFYSYRGEDPLTGKEVFLWASVYRPSEGEPVINKIADYDSRINFPGI